MHQKKMQHSAAFSSHFYLFGRTLMHFPPTTNGSAADHEHRGRRRRSQPPDTAQTFPAIPRCMLVSNGNCFPCIKRQNRSRQMIQFIQYRVPTCCAICARDILTLPLRNQHVQLANVRYSLRSAVSAIAHLLILVLCYRDIIVLKANVFS